MPSTIRNGTVRIRTTTDLNNWPMSASWRFVSRLVMIEIIPDATVDFPIQRTAAQFQTPTIRIDHANRTRGWGDLGTSNILDDRHAND